MLFTIDAVLLGLAGVVTRFVFVASAKIRRRAVADAEAKLAAAGLRAEGDPLSKFVARPLQGDNVVLTSRAFPTRPGISAHVEEACVAVFDVSLGDQIVCESAEADAVMGPLPAVPRVRTGYAPFDQRYAVFVGSTGGVLPSGSYRAAPVASDIPWAQPVLLDRLTELGLRWLRVHEGRAELVFPPLAIEDVGRAAALAVAVEQAACGGPVPALAGGRRSGRIPTPWKNPAFVLGLFWLLSLFTGPLLATVFWDLLASEGVDLDLACEGHQLISVSHNGGRFHFACPLDAQSHLGLYFLACVLLGMALTVLVGIVIAARLFAQHRARTAARG
jgi:hypothetical protein